MKELIILSYLLGIQVANVINFQTKGTQIQKGGGEGKKESKFKLPH